MKLSTSNSVTITMIKQITYSSFYYTLASVSTGSITSTYFDFFGAGQTIDNWVMIFSTLSLFQCIPGAFSCSTAMTYTTTTGSFSINGSPPLLSGGSHAQSTVTTTSAFTLKTQWYECLKSSLSVMGTNSNSLEYYLKNTISKDTTYVT